MKTNEPPPDSRQCDFPNCAGMTLLSATTKATDQNIRDIKESLFKLPEILEHVATSSANIESIRMEIVRILREHDEIFQRLRDLENKSASSSWTKSLKNACIQLAVVIAGAVMLAILSFSMYMIVIHWNDFSIRGK
jgi:hypothetical protein